MRSTLHATFLYHCAFAHSIKRPHVDVLLAPGPKGMQHIASLRVPQACVVDDNEHPGQEQDTEIADRRLSTDVIWRLENYDVWIDPPAGAAALDPARVHVVDDLSVTERDKKWVVANFKRLSHLGIDPRFLQDEVSADLQPGARVRIWGGALRAARPASDLADRLWQLEDGSDPVGLSDQVEFEKDLGDRGTVTLRFRKFGDVRFRTVTLRAAANKDGYGIRLHITNDPTAHELHDPRKATCADLPHFASYALLLRTDPQSHRRLTPPIPFEDPTARRTALTIAEGGGLCCPCGGAPEP